MNDIITVINTVGFPIAVCIYLGWFIKYQEDKHTTELSALNEAIKQNTEATKALITEMRGRNEKNI